MNYKEFRDKLAEDLQENLYERGFEDVSIKFHETTKANVCNYKPVNLGVLIKNGILSSIESIHRETINRASGR